MIPIQYIKSHSFGPQPQARFPFSCTRSSIPVRSVVIKDSSFFSFFFFQPHDGSGPRPTSEEKPFVHRSCHETRAED